MVNSATRPLVAAVACTAPAPGAAAARAVLPRYARRLRALRAWYCGSGALPFLFFLSAEPELGWIEVSEKSLSALDLFRWPLPWNLMRHRLPTARVVQARLWGEQVEGIAASREIEGMDSLAHTLQEDLERLRELAVHVQKSRTNREDAERDALRSEAGRLTEACPPGQARRLAALRAQAAREGSSPDSGMLGQPSPKRT